MIWIIGYTGMLGKVVKLYLLNMPCIISNVDICDYKEITNFIKAYKNIDWIINCAAYTDVDNAESQKDKAFKVNYEGVKNIQCLLKGMIYECVKFV